MSYYIVYPKSKIASVRVLTKRPGRTYTKVGSRWGFAEGPMRTIASVTHRLNAMNIDSARRPVKFR